MGLKKPPNDAKIARRVFLFPESSGGAALALLVTRLRSLEGPQRAAQRENPKKSFGGLGGLGVFWRFSSTASSRMTPREPELRRRALHACRDGSGRNEGGLATQISHFQGLFGLRGPSETCS